MKLLDVKFGHGPIGGDKVPVQMPRSDSGHGGEQNDPGHGGKRNDSVHVKGAIKGPSLYTPSLNQPGPPDNSPNDPSCSECH